ncbi:MAG TPA: hypothetical protein VGD61_15405 [Pyrinomonadaceae bacterium]
MSIVQGIKEKVHAPVFDSIVVKPEEQLKATESSSILKFFVNVQGKTKLETNLQSASLLPHYNTFEARAMRVVISDLPPEFPKETIGKAEDLIVVNNDDEGNPFELTPPSTGAVKQGVIATVEAGLKFLMEKLKEARDTGEDADFPLEDDDDNKYKVTLSYDNGDDLSPADETTVLNSGAIPVTASELEKIIEDLDRKAPPKEQIRQNDGAGTIIGKLVYNTVTTLYVGEKIMIQMPTWFFPSGAGPYSEKAAITTHGEPSPTATFRFAEPIYIDKQQNFRVEIEIPDADTQKEIQKIYGPLSIWVVLDGYMTRDVQ